MPHNPDQRPMSPEEVVAAVFGPPPKEGQKNLQDFIKRELPKPEKPKSLNAEIVALNKEGKEVVFNLEMIRQQWVIFYHENHLPELAKSIETVDIQLTQEQVQQLIEKAEQGFDRLILLPPVELQQQYLRRIKEETEKPIEDLKGEQQYQSKDGIYLYSSVKPNFPDKVGLLNREKTQAKPYFLFLKETPEVDPETLNKTPTELREILNQKNETGLTLPEYFIFQRDYTERHQADDNPHPDTQKYTFLLDSVLPKDSSGSAHVLGANWNLGDSRPKVDSDSPGHSDPDGGSRSSAIFEIL